MHSKSNAGRIHYFHNTIVGQWGGTSNQGVNQAGDTLSIVTRNNCFATDKPAFLKSLFLHPVDCDGDLYRNPGTLPKEQQRHGDRRQRFYHFRCLYVRAQTKNAPTMSASDAKKRGMVTIFSRRDRSRSVCGIFRP